MHKKIQFKLNHPVLFLVYFCSLFLLFQSSFSAQNIEFKTPALNEKQIQEVSTQVIEYLKQNPKLLDDLMAKSIQNYIDRQKELAEKKQQEQAEIEQEQAKIFLTKIKDDDHIKGKKDADYLLIDYSDFQCPYCKRFHPTAEKFIKDNPNVALIYRHFPLPNHNPLATRQALAAECIASINAGDAFWQAVDLIYQNNPKTDNQMINIANQMNISKGVFLSCFSNSEQVSRFNAKIDADLEEGKKVGVKGTPGVFLVNIKTQEIEMIPGAVGIDYLNQALDRLKN